MKKAVILGAISILFSMQAQALNGNAAAATADMGTATFKQSGKNGVAILNRVHTKGTVAGAYATVKADTLNVKQSGKNNKFIGNDVKVSGSLSGAYATVDVKKLNYTDTGKNNEFILNSIH